MIYNKQYISQESIELITLENLRHWFEQEKIIEMIVSYLYDHRIAINDLRSQGMKIRVEVWEKDKARGNYSIMYECITLPEAYKFALEFAIESLKK